MAFTLKIRLPQYRNASGVTVRIYEPGESVRMNGDADDTMADTASDGLFLATIAEDLVGDFEYEVFRSGTTVQTGTLKRIADQAIVIADDPNDQVISIWNYSVRTISVDLGEDGNRIIQLEVRATNGSLVSGARVIVSTDILGQTVIFTGMTNIEGMVSAIIPEAGPYYVFRSHPLYSFTNPVLISVV